jgi:hypothetical protein
MKTTKYNIDLKWSLWSSEELLERYPEVYEQARLAFSAEGDPVEIHTAPRKEIRFGDVTIEDGCASVNFYFEWDEPYEQLWRVEEITGELTEPETESAKQDVCEYFSEMDWGIYKEVGAPTFEELLEKIDEVESELLELEDRQSNAFEEHLKWMGGAILEQRANQK